MAQPTIRDEDQKLRELIVYIAVKCQYDPHFGATWLNKALFYCDFSAFARLGKSITGAEYFALDQGPAPRRLLPVRIAMEEQGDVALQKLTKQHRLVPLREPDLSIFTPQEIALVDSVLDQLRTLDADGVSELSHAFLGWRAAWVEGEAKGDGNYVTIPYSTTFVSNEPLDEFGQARGRELAARHSWPV